MRVIAYYLPQFHTIPENDAWWGKGFTEWTSVRDAKALFKGHEQPVEPGELGYYNLLDPAIRDRQAQLAHEAGIEGFCYWHYWFGGKQLLEQPLQEVLQSGQPDFPFCIAWANESWKAKVWHDASGRQDKTLIEQTYPEGDNQRHFMSILPIIRDKRYIHVDGKPLIVIYRPFQLPDAKAMIEEWQQLAVKAGLKGLYLVGHTMYSSDVDKIKDLGFDAVNVVRLGDCRRSKKMILRHLFGLVAYAFKRRPFVYEYRAAMALLSGPENRREDVFPSLLPRWDHTPRSGKNGFVLHGSTPELFARHLEIVKESVAHKSDEHKVVFLKSWNEWGEGNYIEPDRKTGLNYLNVLKEGL
ncbi:MAG: glycoside hydrolase family 99-like domain-containing protein [Paludibacteraceae bacterium]|nr:glycoside hydrolase family 99-like domain-containing protein [Paludibacteraceae bacterium]